jgi:hypothetical protein
MAGNVDTDVAGFAFLQMGIGAEKIYGWFHDGKGPEQTTDTGQATWSDLATGHAQVSEMINQAVRASGAAWEGAAGDQARAATTPLASWSEVTATSAATAGQNTAEIGQAFREAKGNLQKPVDVPDKPWYNGALPWDTDYDKAVEKRQQVNAHNMQVLNTYGTTASSAGAGMPTFENPGALGANVEQEEKVVPPTCKLKPVEPPKPGGGDDPGDDSDDDTGDDTGDRNGDDTGVTKPTKTDPTIPPGTNDDGTTKKSSLSTDNNKPLIEVPYRPPVERDQRPPVDTRLPIDPRLPVNPRLPIGSRLPVDPRNRPPVPPGMPRGPGGGPGSGPGGGPGGGRGGGPGGMGGGRMPGMGGPGGMGAGFGPGGMSGAMGHGEGRGGFGPGGSGGFGPGGAAGRGGAGAAGMGAGMGAGAGRGQGEEDKEHKAASYLQETEDIFGDGTMVAPPVIGG